MSCELPEAIILAGPNGAGKTSFANAYFAAPDEGLVFVNADEAARRLAPTGHKGGAVDFAASRLVLRQMDMLVELGQEFMVETTLATLAYVRKIPEWSSAGYHISLIYLRLTTVDASISRVKRRVANGGHGIPERVLRRRFSRSLDYLEQIYKPIVDDWSVWDSLEGDFVVSATSDD